METMPTSTPSTKQVFSVVERNWLGMNTSSPRQAINPGQFAWLENIMPLAPGTLAVIPDKVSKTSVSAETINAFDTVTVNGVSYVVGSTTAGNVYAWRTDTWVKSTLQTGTSGNACLFAPFENQYVVFISSLGLYYWDGATTTKVASPPWTGTPQAMAYWRGQMWVAVGLTVFFSAPNSVTDWTVADGAGSFIVTDQYLEGQVTGLVPCTDYLYILGDGAILMAANTQLLSGNVPYFTVMNVDQVDGVLNYTGAEPYGDSLIFANAHGVKALYGMTKEDMSNDMDIWLSNVDYTKTVSLGVGTIYNQTVMAVLAYYTPTASWYLACVFKKKWFLVNMGTLSLLTWVTLNGAPALFATDGTNIYEMFSGTTTAVSFKAVTQFMDAGDPTSYKSLNKVGIEINIPNSSISGSSISFTADTEKGSDSSQSFTIANGYNWLRTNSQQYGQYIGLTITGALAGSTIEGIMAQYGISATWP